MCSADTVAGSAPTVAQEVYRHGLSRGRSILVDRSIQNALIYGIRRAKHFLYVETQYFEGTHHLSPADDCCCTFSPAQQ